MAAVCRKNLSSIRLVEPLSPQFLPKGSLLEPQATATKHGAYKVMLSEPPNESPSLTPSLQQPICNVPGRVSPPTTALLKEINKHAKTLENRRAGVKETLKQLLEPQASATKHGAYKVMLSELPHKSPSPNPSLQQPICNVPGRASPSDPPEVAVMRNGSSNIKLPPQPTPKLQPICNEKGELNVPLTTALLEEIIKHAKTLDNRRAGVKETLKQLELARRDVSAMSELRKEPDEFTLQWEIDCLKKITQRLNKLVKLARKENAQLSWIADHLSTQIEAVWGIHKRKEVAKAGLKEYDYLRRPGASCTTELTIKAPMPVTGAVTGADLVITPNVGVSQWIGNDDEACVQVGYGGSVGVAARLTAKFTSLLKAGLSAKGSLQCTKFNEYNNADHAVNASLANDFPSRLEKPIMPLKTVKALNRIHQNALIQGSRFSNIFGTLEEDGKQQLFQAQPVGELPSVALPCRGVTKTVAVKAGTFASAGGSVGNIELAANSAAEGSASRATTSFEVPQPLWPSVREEGLPPDSSAAKAQAARIQTLIKLAPKHNPWLAKAMANAIRSKAADPSFDVMTADQKTLHTLLNYVKDEFDLYCKFRRLGQAELPHAAKLAQHIENDWEAKNKPLVYLQRLGIAQALIGVRLKTLATQLRQEPQDWKTDLATLDGLANKIYNAPLRCNKQVFMRHLTFVDKIPVVTTEQQFNLELKASCQLPIAGAPNGQLGAEFNFVRRHREHPNPLRAGDYRELICMVSARAGLNQVLLTLWRDHVHSFSSQLGIDREILHQVEPALSALDLSGQLTGTLKLQIRFYRPVNDKPKNPHYPNKKGFRLQFVRVAATASCGMAIFNHEKTKP